MQYIDNYASDNKNDHPLPPTPITDPDGFDMFGQKVVPIETIEDLIPSLTSQNINQVYDSGAADVRHEMKSINVSLVLKYLHLLEILVKNPESPEFETAFGELKNLFENMYFLINRFRPHQARESLITLMESQQRSRQETADHLRKLIEVIKNFKGQAVKSLAEVKVEETDLGNAVRSEMLDGQRAENVAEIKEEIPDWEGLNIDDELMKEFLLDPL